MTNRLLFFIVVLVCAFPLYAKEKSELFGKLPYLFSLSANNPSSLLSFLEKKLSFSQEGTMTLPGSTKLQKRLAHTFFSFLRGLKSEGEKFSNSPLSAFIVSYIAFNGRLNPYGNPSNFVGIAQFQQDQNFEDLNLFLKSMDRRKTFKYSGDEGVLAHLDNPLNRHFLVQNEDFLFMGRSKNKIYELERVTFDNLKQNSYFDSILALHVDISRLKALQGSFYSLIRPGTAFKKEVTALLDYLLFFEKLEMKSTFKKGALSLSLDLKSAIKKRSEFKPLETLRILPKSALFYLGRVIGDIYPFLKKFKNEAGFHTHRKQVEQLEQRIGLKFQHLFWEIGSEFAASLYPPEKKPGLPGVLFLLKVRRTEPFKDFLRAIHKKLVKKYGYLQPALIDINDKDKTEKFSLTFHYFFQTFQITFFKDYLILGMGPELLERVQNSDKDRAGSLGQDSTISTLLSRYRKSYSGFFYFDFQKAILLVSRQAKLFFSSALQERIRFWSERAKFIQYISGTELKNESGIKAEIDVMMN